jgi:hypothetical protein
MTYNIGDKIWVLEKYMSIDQRVQMVEHPKKNLRLYCLMFVVNSLEDIGGIQHCNVTFESNKR